MIKFWGLQWVEFLVEQVKGSEEMKEKIIAAAREARRSPEYPQELLPDLSNSVCDRYLNNYQNNHVQGMQSFDLRLL